MSVDVASALTPSPDPGEAEAFALLSRFFGGRMLDAPGFTSLRRTYVDAFHDRYAKEVMAFDRSESLATLRAEHRHDVVACIHKMSATESWDAVPRYAQTWLSRAIAIGLSFLVGAFMPLWNVANRNTFELVLVCLGGATAFVLIAVILSEAITGGRHVAIYSDDAGDAAGRRSGLATGFACAICLVTGVLVLVVSGLSPLGVVTAALAALMFLAVLGSDFGKPYAEGDARIYLLVAIVSAGVGGVLPALWELDLGWSTVAMITVSAVGAMLAALVGLTVLDEIAAGSRRRAAVIAVLSGAGIAGLMWIAGRLPDWLELGVDSAFASAGLGVLAASACVAAASASRAYLYRWKASAWPQADIVETFVDATLAIEYGNRWNSAPTVTEAPLSVAVGVVGATAASPADETDTEADRERETVSGTLAALRATASSRAAETRSTVAADLTYVATLLRRDLPRQLSAWNKAEEQTGVRWYVAHNEGVDARVHEQTALMSETVEDWLFELVMHGPSGLDNTRQLISKALPCAVRGDWEEFPRARTRASERARSRLRKSVAVVQSLVGALIPVVLVLGVTQSVDLPDGAVASLYTFALTFLAITLLRLLDPKSGGDVQNTQAAFGAMREFASRAFPGDTTRRE